MYLRFCRCEKHSPSFFSDGTNAENWAIFPNRAQAHKWAGSLVDTLNFQMSTEDFSQIPLWRPVNKGVFAHCRVQKNEKKCFTEKISFSRMYDSAWISYFSSKDEWMACSPEEVKHVWFSSILSGWALTGSRTGRGGGNFDRTQRWLPPLCSVQPELKPVN